MAMVSITGKVVGKQSEPAVSVREAKDLKIASFSVLDRQYAYFKNKDDNPGQFYRVEVTGRSAEYLAENLKHGTWVSVTGQGVWREYNGQKYYDIKNSVVTQCEDRKTATENNSPF